MPIEKKSADQTDSVDMHERSLAEQIDAVLQQTDNRYDNSIKMCETPRIYIEAGLSPLPMLYSKKHLREALKPKDAKKPHQHGLTIQQIQSIPELLAQPAMIFDSMSPHENGKKSIVSVLNAVDSDNAPLLVTITPNGQGVYQLESVSANYITSIYGKWPESIVEFLLSWNVMYTLAVSLIALMWMDSQKKWTVQGIVLFALSFSLAGFGDWSLMIPAWAIFFFFTNKYKAKLTNTMNSILYVLGTATVQTFLFAGQYDSFASFSFQLGTVFAIIPIQMYNGKRGSIRHEKLNRWFFYVYYPAHMAVLLLVQAAFS